MNRSVRLIKLLIAFFFTFLPLMTWSQKSEKDSTATIILKNKSKYTFYYYIAAVREQVIAGENLKPGQSKKFTIPLTGNHIYRFTVYLDKERTSECSIGPLEYYEEVNYMTIEKGTYTYNLDAHEKWGMLDVRLVKNK